MFRALENRRTFWDLTVHAVDQPGAAPGLMHNSAASETRLLLPPVTVTTGVLPRRPQVWPLGGLKPWPDSSSKTIQAPRSAAVLLPLARSPPARRRSPPHPARRPAGRDLHAPADPVQQQVHPGQGVLHPEPAAHHLGDPGQRPALVLIPAPCTAGPASSSVSSSRS